MILAESIPDARALQQFLQIVSFFLSMGAAAASVAALFSSRRTQKREVSFTREYASKEELSHLAKDVERLQKTVDEIPKEAKADRTLMMAAADERLEKITVRVDRLLEASAAWKAVKS
jgi:hypothetical protein